MSKKILIIKGILVVFIVLAIYQLQQYYKCSVDDMPSLPKGYVLLDDVLTSTDGTLRCVFWETQISFLNSDGETIYQTSVDNDAFIIKYKGKHYINENYLTCLVEQLGDH